MVIECPVAVAEVAVDLVLELGVLGDAQLVARSAVGRHGARLVSDALPVVVGRLVDDSPAIASGVSLVSVELYDDTND